LLLSLELPFVFGLDLSRRLAQELNNVLLALVQLPRKVCKA
jgi:hypothetical protein